MPCLQPVIRVIQFHTRLDAVTNRILLTCISPLMCGKDYCNAVSQSQPLIICSSRITMTYHRHVVAVDSRMKGHLFFHRKAKMLSLSLTKLSEVSCRYSKRNRWKVRLSPGKLLPMPVIFAFSFTKCRSRL